MGKYPAYWVGHRLQTFPASVANNVPLSVLMVGGDGWPKNTAQRCRSAWQNEDRDEGRRGRTRMTLQPTNNINGANVRSQFDTLTWCTHFLQQSHMTQGSLRLTTFLFRRSSFLVSGSLLLDVLLAWAPTMHAPPTLELPLPPSPVTGGSCSQSSCGISSGRSARQPPHQTLPPSRVTKNSTFASTRMRTVKPNHSRVGKRASDTKSQNFESYPHDRAEGTGQS